MNRRRWLMLIGSSALAAIAAGCSATPTAPRPTPNVVAETLLEFWEQPPNADKYYMLTIFTHGVGHLIRFTTSPSQSEQTVHFTKEEMQALLKALGQIDLSSKSHTYLLTQGNKPQYRITIYRPQAFDIAYDDIAALLPPIKTLAELLAGILARVK